MDIASLVYMKLKLEKGKITKILLILKHYDF